MFGKMQFYFQFQIAYQLADHHEQDPGQFLTNVIISKQFLAIHRNIQQYPSISRLQVKGW